MKDSGLGWAPEIPVGWSLIRAKYLLTKLDRTFRAEDTPLICTNKGKVIERGETNYGLVSSDEMNYQGVHPGDLLIHGMDTWHGAIAMSDLGGKCTTVVHVCDSDQDKRFLCYYYQALAYQNVYKLISNGIRQNTSDFRSFSKFGEIPTFVPPLREQQSIADYLDERCAAVEGVKRTIEDEIEALRRLRRATIHRAVVTDLADTAKVKLSHMAWVGSSTRVFTNELVDSGIPFYRGTEIGAKAVGKFDKPSLYITDEHYERLISQTGKVNPGDLLLPSICYDGQIWHVDNDEPFYFKDGRVLWIRPNHTLAEGRFLRYALASELQLNYELYASGTTFAEMKIVTLKQVPVPYTPLPVQQRIADYLDERCAAIDSVIDTRTRQLERLDDYRRALIFAYVTGKKEVPSHE